MIHFLLTPDKSASLAHKRLVAQQGARMDVVVGTWPELLTLTKNGHILPTEPTDWKTKLTAYPVARNQKKVPRFTFPLQLCYMSATTLNMRG